MKTTDKVTILTDKPPTLEEAQAIVGGYVELINLPDGSQMYVDEEGRLKKLLHNPDASLRANQYVCGPVLILQGTARWMPEDDEPETKTLFNTNGGQDVAE